jgi:hypothetical protein
LPGCSLPLLSKGGGSHEDNSSAGKTGKEEEEEEEETGKLADGVCTEGTATDTVSSEFPGSETSKEGGGDSLEEAIVDGLPSQVREDILRDVARTYVNEPLFREVAPRRRRRPSREEDGRGNDSSSALHAQSNSEKWANIDDGGGGGGGCGCCKSGGSSGSGGGDGGYGGGENDELTCVDSTPSSTCSSSYYSFTFSPGRALLFELLKTLARTLPEVGYCQGLNFVAALALIVAASGAGDVTEARHAKRAFDDGLAVLLPMIHQVRSFFLPGLPGFHRALALLQAEAVERLPLLSAHLHTEGLALHLFAAPWLQCLFTNPKVPLPLALHVCELFLVLGFEAVVRVALALLAHEEKGLLALSSAADMIARLQHATTALAPSQFESLIALGLSFQFTEDVQRSFSEIGQFLGAEEVTANQGECDAAGSR